MAGSRDIEVIVFDVLGTLVDEPSGLRAEIRDAVPASDDASVDELLTLWQKHREFEEQRIAQGHRAYANTEIIGAEAAGRVAGHAGLADPAAVARLATAGQRLPPWSDSVAGLERLARQFPVLGLSHASRTALLRLNAMPGCAGTRRCPPKPSWPTSRRRRSTSSPSIPPDVHRIAC
jgi:2-haloacid dehalogenase